MQGSVRDLQGDRFAQEAVRAGQDQRAGAAQLDGCVRVAEIHLDPGHRHARVDGDGAGHRTVEAGALVRERRTARVPAAAVLPAPALESGPPHGRRRLPVGSHSAGRKVKE